MKRNAPLEFLNILINRYSRCDAFVNWNGIVSPEYFELCVVWVNEVCFHLCYLLFMLMILLANLKALA